jgi:hypothetical protein
MFTSCMDSDLSLIVQSKPIVATLPDPVALALALSIIIVALYSDVLTLYSDMPYSAILALATVTACFVYPG